jgi:hypothetical protein
MKNFYMFLLFSCSIFLNPILLYSENNEADQSITGGFHYLLSGNILYKINSYNKTRLLNNIAEIFETKDCLYYLRSNEEKWIAGFLKRDSSEPSEFEISGVYEKLYKFTVFNEVFYILVSVPDNTIKSSSQGKRILLRFNPDNNKIQIIEGVRDFILIEGKPVLLKDKYVDYNGAVIPHLLTGEVRIINVINSRILFIADENSTEVIDLLNCVSFYQYGDNQLPVLSKEFNLIVEFVDVLTESYNSKNSVETIYYEILIDGVEESRTETGRGEILKIFHANLAPGKYHIIRPERWELDKSKSRYVRVNNISQPGELKIFIPENRVIKIRVEFNGSGYKLNQSVLLKNKG